MTHAGKFCQRMDKSPTIEWIPCTNNEENNTMMCILELHGDNSYICTKYFGSTIL